MDWTGGFSRLDGTLDIPEKDLDRRAASAGMETTLVLPEPRRKYLRQEISQLGFTYWVPRAGRGYWSHKMSTTRGSGERKKKWVGFAG